MSIPCRGAICAPSGSQLSSRVTSHRCLSWGDVHMDGGCQLCSGVVVAGFAVRQENEAPSQPQAELELVPL